MLCHVTYFCPQFQFCVLRCLCSTTCFWFPGLLLCHTPSSAVWPPASAPSGHVWSSSVRCCTSCRPSSLRTSLWTVHWWASEMEGPLAWPSGKGGTPWGTHVPQPSPTGLRWLSESEVSWPRLSWCWFPLKWVLPIIPVSLCSNPRETSLNSPDCGAISYSFLFSFQPNENQTNIPLHQLNKSLLYSAPIDPTEWVGLRKSSPLLVYLRVSLPHP